MSVCSRCGATADGHTLTRVYDDGSQKTISLCERCVAATTAFDGANFANAACGVCGAPAAGGVSHPEAGKHWFCAPCIERFQQLSDQVRAASPQLFEPEEYPQTLVRLVDRLKAGGE